MYFYKMLNKFIVSNFQLDSSDFSIVSEEDIINSSDYIYYATNISLGESKCISLVTSIYQLNKSESLKLIDENNFNSSNTTDNWIEEKIREKRLFSLNVNYPNWKEHLNYTSPDTWRVHVVGLGDVGGTLLSGLKLMGSKTIKNIGIFDLDKNKVARWHYEIGQILSPSYIEDSIDVYPIEEQDLFNCDMFVFCVSVGIPKIGEESETDVRMAQLQGNSKVVNYYAKLARKHKFRGTFAVVSDPVDQLCESAYLSSNCDENGNLDYEGLLPEQIKGFGLGVMNARAAFFAKENSKTLNYLQEGRAFGPHGEGLIIANSINNFDEHLSDELTLSAKTANLKVREVGYKPYIAPALSSGALSLIAHTAGEWHYSSNFIGGKYFGMRNRRVSNTCELETYKLPKKLLLKLQETYDSL